MRNLIDIWNDSFPPINLYNCPNTHKYEQFVLGRKYKTVDSEPQMNKVKVPVKGSMIDGVIKQNPHLHGVVESCRTVFYNEQDEPLFEQNKYILNGQEYTSYAMYMNQYEQEN